MRKKREEETKKQRKRKGLGEENRKGKTGSSLLLSPKFARVTLL